MRALFVIVVTYMLAGCATVPPGEDWTKADTRRDRYVQAALAGEAVTTARITRRGSREIGVSQHVIGDYPDPAESAVYHAALGLGYHWLAKRLKPKWRRRLQWWLIASHGASVIHNCHVELC